MSATLDTLDLCDAVVVDAVRGLTAQPKTLPAWLFYDGEGTLLFEKITCLPEYYLTRIERDLLQCHARELLDIAASGACLKLVELGAGTANKTGFLLREALQRQQRIAYQPVDVSETRLRSRRETLNRISPEWQCGLKSLTTRSSRSISTVNCRSACYWSISDPALEISRPETGAGY